MTIHKTNPNPTEFPTINHCVVDYEEEIKRTDDYILRILHVRTTNGLAFGYSITNGIDSVSTGMWNMILENEQRAYNAAKSQGLAELEAKQKYNDKMMKLSTHIGKNV